MAQIIWTEPALQDLDAIADYISLDKPEAAARLVRRVFHRVDQLETHPDNGSIPPDLRGTPYRHVVIPPLRIFYRHHKGTIHILYVLRSERQFRDVDLIDRDRLL